MFKKLHYKILGVSTPLATMAFALQVKASDIISATDTQGYVDSVLTYVVTLLKNNLVTVASIILGVSLFFMFLRWIRGAAHGG